MPHVPVVKVTILGDGGVGKTSLMRRYCTGKFRASRVMTIGVDFQTKVVSIGENEVKLSIWDIAGQKRFQFVRGGFYRGSLASALIYDLTDVDSLKNLLEWRLEIMKSAPDVKFVVAGNKLDIFDRTERDWGGELARRIGAAYLQTSALTGEGVEDLFLELARLAFSAMKGE
jgi:small GTP-binding protein